MAADTPKQPSEAPNSQSLEDSTLPGRLLIPQARLPEPRTLKAEP